MVLLVSDVVVGVRDRLNESTAAAWTDTQIKRWANESLRDLARTTKHIMDTTTFNTVSGTGKYTLAATIIEVDEVWVAPGDGRLIPLTGKNPSSMNNIWGSWQNQVGGDPLMFSLWGVPPTMQIQLFPVPSVTGMVVTVNHRRTAAKIVESNSVDNTAIDFPEVWVDLLKDYAEFRAQKADGQMIWKDAYQIYLANRDSLLADDYSDDTDTVNVDPYSMMPGGTGGFYGAW